MPEDESPTLVEGDYDLEHIFAATAAAVVGAQRRLDAELRDPYRHTYELWRERRLFSIPRTTVELVFGLEIDERQRLMWLVPRGSARRQLHRHRLLFSVVAQPAPPPHAPPLSPPPLGPGPGFALTAPRFLLASDEEQTLSALLLSTLHANSPDWKSRLPGGKQPDEDDFAEERLRIINALKRPDAETGMVFLRLDGEPRPYLVVRVTGKEHNDSIFVVRPDAPSPPAPNSALRRVEIFSMEGDDAPEVSYEPLHRLGLALRRWQAGEMAAHSFGVPGGVPLRFGLQYLQSFAEGMRDGYARGLAELSAQPGAEATGVWYDFAGVEAELSYSVEYEEGKKPRFRFDLRRPPDNAPLGGDEAYKLVESRARVAVTRGAGGEPRVGVELLTPEFMLSGDAWRAFMRLASASVDEIARAFARGSPEEERRYRGFLTDDLYRRDAVVLLAYRGKTPKEEFLAIWPGLSREGRARDFVFTARRKGERLRVGDTVMTLDEDLGDVKITAPAGAAADSDITGEQYQPFHNFFHAVRIWRARMRPS